jgi:hypothetical protein
MFKLEQQDEFAKGSIAGFAGAVVKYIFNELMQFLNIAKYDNNATSITLTMTQYEHSTFYLVCFLNALFVGMIFGIIIAFVFSYIFTERFLFYKGAAIGVFIFLLNFGILSLFFNYPEDITALPGDMISMLLSLIIYSLVTTYVLKKLQICFKLRSE